MSNVSVACIAVSRDKKILIAKRIPGGDMGERWEFPGGKVEAGESEQEACVREIKEEFGIKIKAGGYICESAFEHKGETRLLHAYRIYVPHKGLVFKYKLTEHTEYKWVSLDEIKNLKFVNSDLLLYADVKNYVNNL